MQYSSSSINCRLDQIQLFTGFNRHFIRRGYPIPLLIESFTKARHTDRSTLLNQFSRGATDERVNILVSTYNTGFQGLRPIVAKNWYILGRSCSTRQIRQQNLVMAFRKPTNLRNILVRTKLPIRWEPGPLTYQELATLAKLGIAGIAKN